MSTFEEAREFVSDYGNELMEVGESSAGWTVVSSTYSWFKHSTVYFTVVTADPDGDLWQYTVGSDYNEGTAVSDGPIPVSAEVELKQVVTYRPRLIPRET